MTLIRLPIVLLLGYGAYLLGEQIAHRFAVIAAALAPLS